MNQDQIIYQRTAQGETALMARRSDLGPALNSLLVLVNGKTTREDLMTLVTRLGAPANSLSMLEVGGYIQPRNAPGAPAAVTANDSPNKDVTITDTERRTKLYQHLIEAATQHLGLTGFIYHLKVEKAVTLQDLSNLVGPLGKAIAKAKGMETANAFMKIVRPLAIG